MKQKTFKKKLMGAGLSRDSANLVIQYISTFNKTISYDDIFMEFLKGDPTKFIPYWMTESRRWILMISAAVRNQYLENREVVPNTNGAVTIIY